MNARKCIKCMLVLNFSEFGKDKSKKNGIANRCKKCLKAYAAARYLRDKEKIAAQSKIYRSDPLVKAKSAERSAKWRSENTDRRNEISANWAKRNPEKIRQQAESNMALLKDSYVAGILGMSVADAPAELINLKREQLQQKRLLKELTEAINEATKGEEK